MIKMSSALKFYWMGGYGLQYCLHYGYIRIYEGPQPEGGDAAATGTLLGTVSTDGQNVVPGTLTGGGLMTQQVGYGVVQHLGNWQFKTVAAGVPGWFRFYGNHPDDGTLDTPKAKIRLDGLVGNDAELRLGYPSVGAGELLPVRFYLQFRNL
jgi:hypothetical protein